MYGEYIKIARIGSGLSQEDVEKITGIPQATLSRIETNRNMPNIEQCKLLAECYGITIDELIEEK